MTVRMGVNGASELAATFRAIAAAASPKNRESAREAALEVIKAQAVENLRSNGSILTGALAAAQVIVPDDQKSNRSLLGTKKGIVNRQSPSSYEHLVEFGTAPHYQPNRFGGIMHPGARPKPFKGPAVQQASGQAIEAYRKAMVESVQAAAARSQKRKR